MRFLTRFVDRLKRDDRGAIALKFALIAPAAITLGVGAIDLLSVHTAQSRLQALADASALAGAPSLGLARDGTVAKARASDFIAFERSQWAGAPAFTSELSVVDVEGQRGLKVELFARRPSFFGNLLPPGGWRFRAEAIASTLNQVPLCVLATGISEARTIQVKDRGRVNAPACMVHSNRDVSVDGQGLILAAMTQAVGKARGAITPNPGTGAPAIEDPLVTLDLDQTKKGYCSGKDVEKGKVKVTEGIHYVSAGEHCGGIDASGTARIILQSGDHFMLGGHLTIKDSARLEGRDVAIFFDRKSKFDFRDQAIISLDGRKSGPYAGLVMGGTRDNVEDFVISADHVENLLGVIYVPSARLIVEGKANVARDSAWTVIVAEGIQLRGSPQLFMNANYAASDVPVPSGVGPRTGGAKLVN